MERILKHVKNCVSQFSDKRTGKNKQYRMEEIGMAAYSVFHMQSSSFLEHQQKMEKKIGSHNGESLFGFQKIPTDNHIRTCLDHVKEDECSVFFENILNEIDLTEWMVNGRLTIAIDGVTFFSSSKINCSCCLKKEHRNGTVTYSHAALCPVIVHPFEKRIIPLMPEFIKNEDGFDKQDCEINAAKRWINKKQDFLSQHKVILIADDLFSRGPLIEQINDIPEIDYIFVAKDSSHEYMKQWFDDLLEQDKGIFCVDDKKYASHVFNYEFCNQIPLNSTHLKTSYFTMTVHNKKGKQLYFNSFVTSLKLDKKKIHTIACIGRNRWRIENEAFNILKNNGYHLEHNFGHGKKHLSNILAILNIMAFTVHVIWRIIYENFDKLFDAFSSRKQVFYTLSTLTMMLHFESWETLFNFVKEKFDL